MQRNILATILTTLTVTALSASIAGAATVPEIKCQAAKLKASGKHDACLKKEHGDLLLGKTDDSATCDAKFQTALAKADATAAKKGATCRYLDNGNGSVGDLNTGLTWEKKDNLGGGTNFSDPHDADNYYTWSTGSPYPANGTAYTDFLAKLNNGTSSDGTDTPTPCFAGHCDWRLPTIQELQTILLSAYPCGTSPCIDSTLGPTQSDNYWSSTTYSSNAAGAWDVGFGDGGVGANGKTDFIYYVRAVRSGL